MVISLERGADCLHTVQLMPLPSQNPQHLLRHLNPDWFYLSGTDSAGCPGKEAVKCACVVAAHRKAANASDDFIASQTVLYFWPTIILPFTVNYWQPVVHFIISPKIE